MEEERKRGKKMSVRIEKGRKGGKNRVGTAKDKEKRDRSGHILSRKGKILEFGTNWDNVCSPNCAIS